MKNRLRRAPCPVCECTALVPYMWRFFKVKRDTDLFVCLVCNTRLYIGVGRLKTWRPSIQFVGVNGFRDAPAAVIRRRGRWRK